jgi:hypothetical protein
MVFKRVDLPEPFAPIFSFCRALGCPRRREQLFSPEVS